MELEDLVGLAIPVAFFAFWGAEALVNARGGGRSFPRVRGWALVGIGFFLVVATINVSVPLWLPPDWIAEHRLLDLSWLGLWGARLCATCRRCWPSPTWASAPQTSDHRSVST